MARNAFYKILRGSMLIAKNLTADGREEVHTFCTIIVAYNTYSSHFL